MYTGRYGTYNTHTGRDLHVRLTVAVRLLMVPNVLLLAIQKYSTPLTLASVSDIGGIMVSVVPVCPKSCCPPLYHVMSGAGSPDTSHVSVNPI